MDEISKLIDASHEAERDDFRPHLGCSLLGHQCDRYLWLSFRWAIKPHHSGRILRLFRRGQNEEATIISDLRRIGVHVESVGSKQTRVELGSHIAGSVDAIVSRMPNGYAGKAVAEFKTHSEKSFNELVKAGVRKAKLMHYVQAHVYAYALKLPKVLYYAVNKNTDAIYTEWMDTDIETAERYVDRGRSIALADEMPAPLSTDPSWYECKFCDFYDFCHTTKTTTQVNCRTCAHSTALANSTWRCERFASDGIPVEFQRKGCDSHALHPELVPWERIASEHEWEALYLINGTPIRNGEGDRIVFSSHELLANPAACVAALHDPELAGVREAFDARVVG